MGSSRIKLVRDSSSDGVGTFAESEAVVHILGWFGWG